MTRSEFIENVQGWDDLMEMATEHDCEPLYDIHSQDELDEVVCNAIREELRHSYWTDIRDWLQNIDVYTEYFLDRGYFEYENLNNDSDFEEYKSRVLQWGDSKEIWDPEEEEDDWIEEDEDAEAAESSDDWWLPPWKAATYGVPGRCESFEPAPIADLIAML